MVQNLAAELQGFMTEQGFESIEEFKGLSLPCLETPATRFLLIKFNAGEAVGQAHVLPQAHKKACIIFTFSEFPRLCREVFRTLGGGVFIFPDASLTDRYFTTHMVPSGGASRRAYFDDTKK